MTKASSVHIQSIGTRPAIAADELRVGDVRLYNQGTTATVVDIEQASDAYLFITTDHGSGRITSKVRKTTLVAVVA